MDAGRKKSGPAAAHQKDAQTQQAERGRSRFRNGAQGVFLHLVFRQNGRVQVKIIQGVFFREMKYQEVADYLGISINTVKTLLKNGMRHLRERFAERVDLFLIIVLIKKVGIQRKEKESFIE